MHIRTQIINMKYKCVDVSLTQYVLLIIFDTCHIEEVLLFHSKFILNSTIYLLYQKRHISTSSTLSFNLFRKKLVAQYVIIYKNIF